MFSYSSRKGPDIAGSSKKPMEAEQEEQDYVFFRVFVACVNIDRRQTSFSILAKKKEKGKYPLRNL
jgi:hypothetical protein